MRWLSVPPIPNDSATTRRRRLKGMEKCFDRPGNRLTGRLVPKNQSDCDFLLSSKRKNLQAWPKVDAFAVVPRSHIVKSNSRLHLLTN
jgi:hypothetical protein